MKPKTPYDRATKAAEAHRLLTSCIGDLCAGNLLLIGLPKQRRVFPTAPESLEPVLRRMCIFHLVLALSKLDGVLKEYKAVFSSDVRGIALGLRKELARRGVLTFRNAVVAHYRDKDKRLLSSDEMEEAVAPILGESLMSFNRWIDTVTATCERIRDRLAKDKAS